MYKDSSGVGVRDGLRRRMSQRWKYADWVMLLMCAVKESVLSRKTSRLFTRGQGRMEELSKEFVEGDFLPIRSSVLSLLSLMKFEVNQDLTIYW